MSSKDSTRKSKRKSRKDEKWVEVTASPKEELKARHIKIDRYFPDHSDDSQLSAKRRKKSSSCLPHEQYTRKEDKVELIGHVPVPGTSASATSRSAVDNPRKRKHEDTPSYSDKRQKQESHRRTPSKTSDIQWPRTGDNFKGKTKHSYKQLPRRRQGRWKVPPPEDFIGFAGKDNELSNFYPCQLYVYGRLFGSTEHAYQWSKAMCMRNHKAAIKIYEAAHAGKAKRIANQCFRGVDLSAWIPWRIPVMKKLLRAKARCCKPFRDVLLDSGEKLIAEVVPRERFWGIDDGTGENMMGKLLMELRHNLDDALNSDPDEDGKMIDFSNPPPQNYTVAAARSYN